MLDPISDIISDIQHECQPTHLQGAHAVRYINFFDTSKLWITHPISKTKRTSKALMRSCGFLTKRRFMKFLALLLIDDHASWWNWYVPCCKRHGNGNRSVPID